jgi:hypothetical protein
VVARLVCIPLAGEAIEDAKAVGATALGAGRMEEASSWKEHPRELAVARQISEMSKTAPYHWAGFVNIRL